MDIEKFDPLRGECLSLLGGGTSDFKGIVLRDSVNVSYIDLAFLAYFSLDLFISFSDKGIFQSCVQKQCRPTLARGWR